MFNGGKDFLKRRVRIYSRRGIGFVQGGRICSRGGIGFVQDGVGFVKGEG